MQPTSLVPGTGSKTESTTTTSKWNRPRYYRRLATSTVGYLLHTEVHTFAFSVAANAILSFFPFVLLLMTLVLRVFHSATMYRVIVELLRDYVPAGQEFVIRNLSALATAKNRPQLASFFILLVTSTGIFMPLEVALNRIWRFPNNRSYLGNQIIALGLAFACGILSLISIALSAGNLYLLRMLAFGHEFFLIRILDFMDRKSLCNDYQHGHFFPDLLAAAQWQSPGEKRTAGCHYHGIAFRNSQILLHSSFAALRFSGSLRPLRDLCQYDVLGILVRIAATHRGTSFRAKNIPQRELTAASFLTLFIRHNRRVTSVTELPRKSQYTPATPVRVLPPDCEAPGALRHHAGGANRDSRRRTNATLIRGENLLPSSFRARAGTSYAPSCYPCFGPDFLRHCTQG